MTQSVYLCRIRFWLAIVIVGLVLNGITAFPLQIELGWLVSFLHTSWLQPIAESVHLLPWVERVNEGLTATNAHYPFLAQGERLLDCSLDLRKITRNVAYAGTLASGGFEVHDAPSGRSQPEPIMEGCMASTVSGRG
jgi:hypothetical protein